MARIVAGRFATQRRRAGVLTLKPSRDRIGGGSHRPVNLTPSDCGRTLFSPARLATYGQCSITSAPGHAAPKRERLRVGLLLHDPLLALPVHPDCVHATQLIGTILEARGHHVELDFPPAIEQFLHALLSVQPELRGLTPSSGCTGSKLGSDAASTPVI